MIRYRQMDSSLDVEAVLRKWVRREAQKTEYPDTDPDKWDEERLVTELRTTYEEPVRYAIFRVPEWTTLVVSGSELEKFDTYPSIGCNWLTGGEGLGGLFERLQTGDVADECPDVVEKISTFRGQSPDQDLGAVVIRQYEEFWPPVTLDGNHRAWATILAAREGLDATLRVHFGHETLLDGIPVERERGEPN